MSRRKFNRPLGERRYRKLFIIATEGIKTEPQYFSIFNNCHQNIIRIKCLQEPNRSMPIQVLKRMKRYLKEEGIEKFDEAWLVVDRDEWSDDQLQQLFDWSKSQKNYGFALSNPNFEYWLLLHFEDGKAIKNKVNCLERLKKHLPGYDKSISANKINFNRVKRAISRAKERDKPPCTDWPRAIGQTTVYKLVEKLI